MGEQLKLPPFNIEAEQNVLGAIMHNASKFDDVADILTADDFYRRDHRYIFAALQTLVESNTPTDAVTLADALERMGELDNVGGLSYLGILQNDVVAFNAKAYAKIVKEKSVERALIQTGNEICSIGYSEKPFQEKIDSAQLLIQNIAEDNSKTGPKEIRSVLSQCINNLDERFNNKGTLTGLSTGLIDLDKMLLGLQNSNLIIIAGRPSMGKTALALNIANSTSKAKIPTLFFSLEMAEIELADRLICSEGKVNSHNYRSGKLDDTDWPKVTHAVGSLRDFPLFIDETPALNITQIRARARKIKREHGLGLIIVDYLQLMSGHGENRTQVISEISRGLKSLAKELNIPVVALSQLNRGLENRVNKRPNLSDLRESGQIEQDADVILFIYRDEVYHEDSPDKGLAEIIIGKQRNGRIGTINTVFLGQYFRFENFTGERIQPEPKVKPLREIYK